MILVQQGPVVQNIVSATGSLRGQLLSVLPLYNQIQGYFAEKNERLQKLLTFFSTKILLNSR